MKLLTFSYIDQAPGACLHINREIVATALEKNYYVGDLVHTFPENSIREVIDKGNISVDELDILAYKGKPFYSFECLIEMHLKHFPHSFFSFKNDMIEYLFPKFTLIKKIREKLNYRKALCYINPHDALAFWESTSKNKPSFIITILTDISTFGSSCCYKLKAGDLILMKQLYFSNILPLLSMPNKKTAAKNVLKLIEMLSRIIKECDIEDTQTSCVLTGMITDPLVRKDLEAKFPNLSFVIIDDHESLIKTSEYAAKLILEEI